MRTLAVLPLAVAAAALAAPATAGAAPPFLKLTPNRIHLGETTTIKGTQWPVIEFCKRRVRLRLESDQNAVLIGFSHISDNGRFSRNFTPRKSKIGAGHWRV